jgi:3-isopropylmalate/(R)-2-methylmalate dehydratase small subunit
VRRFVSETGRVAILDRPDVDTDQIVPKQFLKRIDRVGIGRVLFHDWRFDDDGDEHPGFELHQPHATDATILLTGRNFGCGSSREHAAWALQDYGFVAVVAPSFGDIFRTNASKIGLLTVELPEHEVKRTMEVVDLDRGSEMTIHLEHGIVVTPDGREIEFEIDPTVRHRLLHGLDEIALTLQREHHIDAHERSRGIA